MTSRERVQAALRFEPPDRLPCNESPWEDTVAAWYEQGLPEGVSLADHFGFDLQTMSLDVSPRFPQQLLRREGDYIVYTDRQGYTVKKLDGRSSTMEFSGHVTTDRAAWEALRHRWRLSDDPSEPARIDEASYFAHFAPYPTWAEAKEQHRRLQASERYMLFTAYGPWEATWRHRGYEALLMDLAADPDWVAEMGATHQDLVIAVLQRCLDLGMRPDGFFMVEDLACERGLLMSPTTWRRVLRPSVERLGAFLAEHGIDLWMHCCGNPEVLFEDLIECGVRVMQPLQASAGLDAVDLRGRYGDRLVLYGNIDVKRMTGPREELEREIRRKAVLAREGGYILHSDHSLPPQVSLEQYRWMLRTAHDAFEKGN